MRTLLFSLAALVLIASSSLSVRLRYFTTEYDAGAVVITWETEAETDVSLYQLYRKSDQADSFSRITEIAVHGVDTPYRVRDDRMYKAPATIVEYRLEAVMTSGLRQRIAERKVNYTPTAILRSWGSIKAMFQN